MFLRLASCFVVLVVCSIVVGIPLDTTSQNPNEDSEVYDQRQNGTENYRIHVNGVVVLVAPADTVLQASQLSNFQMVADTESTGAATVLKPKPRPPIVPEKENPEVVSHGEAAQNTVSHDKHDIVSHNTEGQAHHHIKDPKEKTNLNLLNLLQMFRHIKQETEGTIEHLSHQVQH